MYRRRSDLEKGQSIVLLALAFVAMLGFAGLAIDGGILYTERRRAQNAADAAALAGAVAKLNGGDPIAAAFNMAAGNGFDDNEISNWVEVYDPPVDGPFAGNSQYIQVKIRARVDTVFAHLVYGGILENRVMAVGRARPASTHPLLMGNAIVGLAPTGCAVVWAHGDSLTAVLGSGVFVNSNDPDCAFRASGNIDFEVYDGAISVVGGFEIVGGSSVYPVPVSGATPIEVPELPIPECSEPASFGAGTVTPGYADDFDFPSGDWTLQPGVYCVDGGFRVNGGTFTGDGVTIYVMSGDVTFNGNATINLSAPDGGEWAGMLIYQDPANDSAAVINGTSASHFTGSMYMPGAQVSVEGTGDVDGFHSQVVGQQVVLGGTADETILYNEEENYQVREPPRVDLAQ